MRGLLIKDFKLMRAQNNFFVFIVAIAIGLAMLTENPSFIIGYLTLIGSMFTLSSISYDEFDNGNAFLFSLPINRKVYIVEKYSFGLIIGGGSWLLATIIVIIAGQLKNTNLRIDETMIIALLNLLVMLVILAVMLPLQLKFGGEKSRVVIMGAVGMMFVISVITVKIAKALNIDLTSMFNHLPTVSMGMLIVIAIGIAIITLLISYKISLSIINKKEF